MEKNIVKLADAGGDSLEVQEWDGTYFPQHFDVDVLRNYQSVNIRPDDVILTNFPKSGTHWFWEILSQLVARKAENIRHTWKGELMLEWATSTTLDSAPSPRILNTHVRFDQLPPAIVEKKCKIVHLLRNPKDVAVSFYHHHFDLKFLYKYNGQWRNYLSLFLNGQGDWGSWFDNTLSYLNAKKQRPELPIFTTFYEDMIKDPVSSITQLAEFLGVEVDDRLCRDIASKCQIDNMRAVAKETGKALIQDGEPVVFRKGGVGGWKTWFTVAQNEEFDRAYAEKMGGVDLHFKYSL